MTESTLRRGLAALSGPVAYGITQVVNPGWVEANYALGIGQPIASGLGDLNGLVGFSVVEVTLWSALAVGVAVGLVRLTQRGRGSGGVRGDLLRLLGGMLGRGLVAASALYAIFVLCWGLDYRREPIIGRFGFPAGPSTAAEVKSLAIEQIASFNQLRSQVPEDAAGIATLHSLAGDGDRHDPFPRRASAMAVRDVVARVAEAYDRAAVRWPFLEPPGASYARAKPVHASILLSWAGLGGVYCPFTGEPNFNADELPIHLAFSIAHETAHQRGIAREDEANFVAWIVLRDFGEGDMRYSALWEGAFQALDAYGSGDAAGALTLWHGLSPGVQRDVRAESAWREHYKSPLAALSERINGAYLRSNGVDDGVRSYGRVVDLMVAERRLDPTPLTDTMPEGPHVDPTRR